MKELEKNLKALANRRRLAILKFLKNRKSATVSGISDDIELSFKSTSRHLSLLKAADIVDRNQSGLEMHYFILPRQKPAAAKIIDLL